MSTGSQYNLGIESKEAYFKTNFREYEYLNLLYSKQLIEFKFLYEDNAFSGGRAINIFADDILR